MSPRTSERPHTHEMVVVHRVFRRESALLPRLVRAVPAGATDRAAVVADHLAEYMTGLHHHHTVEDETLWPLLRARTADQELVARMEEQHGRIDASLAAITEHAPGWRRTADRAVAQDLAAALDEHRAALLEHLDDEERLVLPLVAEHLTVAEWDTLGRRGMETVPKNKLMLALGALFEEATPQEQEFFLSKAPLVGRLIWKAVGRRQYAAACRSLRGPLDGGAAR
ncbi:hemerythrin domain-containing protein [Streptomyces sp. 3211]|uniref:hemerythrin domain-containing protein n=1 Tax=Streptomyces sp. 3211 TaxID=1964449 RepID=UPI00178E26E4|nr:hemerythrin domain-containing protein [Streptomyces sp. 3211]